MLRLISTFCIKKEEKKGRKGGKEREGKEREKKEEKRKEKREIKNTGILAHTEQSSAYSEGRRQLVKKLLKTTICTSENYQLLPFTKRVFLI